MSATNGGMTEKGWTAETLQALGVARRSDGGFELPTTGGTLVYYDDGRHPKTRMAAGGTREMWPAPETIAGETLFVVEGEADVISMHELGFSQVISLPGTSYLPTPERVARLISGRTRVYFVTDFDDGGRALMADWAAACAESVEAAVVDLEPHRNDKQDVGDMLAEALASQPETARERVARLVDETASWAPLAGPRDEVSHVPAPYRNVGRGTGRFAVRGVDLARIEPVRFGWYPWLVRGALNLAVGEEGIGKSTLQAYIAAGVTTGTLAGDFEGAGSDILFIGADEDDWHSVTAPRLLAAGADLDRVREIYPEDDLSSFNVVDHAAELDRLLSERTYGLVVIEQMLDVLPEMRSYNDPAAIRRAVKPLRRVLRRHNVTGLGTLHVNKAAAATFRQAQQGSSQLGAVSRSSFLVARHPDDPLRRVMVLGKANYVRDSATAMSFVIEDAVFDQNGHTFSVGRAAQFEDEPVEMSDVLERTTKREVEREERVEKVAGALDGKPQSVRAIAGATRISKSTVDRLLREMEDRGEAVRGEGGWTCPTSQLPIGERDMGHPQNAIFDSDDEEH